MKSPNCPCGNDLPYSDCCAKAHENHRSVKTAEALMRSRYSAFALGNGNYLQQSHAISTRPSIAEGNEIESWAKSVSWVKLEVLNTAMGTHSDLEGTVEFVAYFLESGTMNTIKENSYFEKKNGAWYYVGYAP
jgi:SEC-C motif-containing protein